MYMRKEWTIEENTICCKYYLKHRKDYNKHWDELIGEMNAIGSNKSINSIKCVVARVFKGIDNRNKKQHRSKEQDNIFSELSKEII